jgi:pseudouridine synthase
MMSEETKKKLEQGIYLDGQRMSPFHIKFITQTPKGNSCWKVSIIEGKKHILRKAFRYSGHPIKSLKRIAIGNILLKKLPPGHWRELTQAEVYRFKKRYHYNGELLNGT